MTFWLAALAQVVGWDGWVLRRDSRGVERTVWTTTASGAIRWLNRRPWRRVALLLVFGAFLYHVELEEELHEVMCSNTRGHPRPNTSGVS